MNSFTRKFTRRSFMQGLGVIGASTLAGGVFAEEKERWIESGDFAQDLVATPAQTEGPFFPDKLPLDTDNDLLIINNNLTPAVGEVTHLSGRIVSLSGEPLKDTVIEIWQVDHQGAYIHSGSANREKQDKNFQGFGRFLTGSTGEYRFRTIKPVAYPGRPPHIHVKVRKGSKELLTTQCYIKGDPKNDKDMLIQFIRDPKSRASLIVPFEPLVGSRTNELAAKFDIVIGMTPSD